MVKEKAAKLMMPLRLSKESNIESNMMPSRLSKVVHRFEDHRLLFIMF